MADIFILFENAALELGKAAVDPVTKATFDPENLKQMGEAYDLVKRVLPDADSYNIARAIIGMAEGGIVDAPTLAARTLDLLGAPDQRLA